MAVRINHPKRQEGLTLIEVMVSLVILALITISFLTIFTTSGIWIVNAGKETIAQNYAASIIELVKAHSSDLALLAIPELELSDTDITDQVFTLELVPGKVPLQVQAPPNMTATVYIRPYEDTLFYDQDKDGVKDFEKYFANNLLTVDVTVGWQEKGQDKTLQLSTITGAR